MTALRHTSAVGVLDQTWRAGPLASVLQPLARFAPSRNCSLRLSALAEEYKGCQGGIKRGKAQACVLSRPGLAGLFHGATADLEDAPAAPQGRS